MIGIYDSGVGGLSIYKSLRRELPRENFVYVADKKYFPYGDKSTTLIRERADAMCGWLEDRGVKLIVVACNTATVSALDYMRKRHPGTPIVGTVPTIKKAAQFTKNGSIGVVCTPKTARSRYQKNLIAEFAADKTVYVRALPKLVEEIEKGNTSSDHIISIINTPLAYLKNKKIDVLALGCSHFPLVVPHIQKSIGREVLILDSGDAIARQVARVLKNNKTLTKSKKIGGIKFFTTTDREMFDIIISRYMNLPIKSKLINI